MRDANPTAALQRTHGAKIGCRRAKLYRTEKRVQHCRVTGAHQVYGGHRALQLLADLCMGCATGPRGFVPIMKQPRKGLLVVPAEKALRGRPRAYYSDQVDCQGDGVKRGEFRMAGSSPVAPKRAGCSPAAGIDAGTAGDHKACTYSSCPSPSSPLAPFSRK